MYQTAPILVNAVTPKPIKMCNILLQSSMYSFKTFSTLIRKPPPLHNKLPPHYIKWWYKDQTCFDFKVLPPLKHRPGMIWCQKITELFPVERFDQNYPPPS